MKCVKCNNTIARSLVTGWKHLGAADHVAMPRYEIQKLIKDLSYLKYGPVIFEAFVQITGNKYTDRALVMIIFQALKRSNTTADQVNEMIQIGVDNGYPIYKQIKSIKNTYGQL